MKDKKKKKKDMIKVLHDLEKWTLHSCTRMHNGYGHYDTGMLSLTVPCFEYFITPAPWEALILLYFIAAKIY